MQRHNVIGSQVSAVGYPVQVFRFRCQTRVLYLCLNSRTRDQSAETRDLKWHSSQISGFLSPFDLSFLSYATPFSRSQAAMGWKAWARWLMASFLAGLSSPKVRSSLAGTKSES